MHKLSRSFLLTGALAMAGLVGCGDDVTVNPDRPGVTSVTVTPQSVALQVGDRATFTAGVVVTGNAATTVTWSSSNTAVATVDANGVVTAVAPGNATIIATSTVDTNQRGSALVTVTRRDLGIRSITLQPPSATLAPGQTLQAVANVDAASGISRSVTWTSSNTAVATVSATGVITAVTPGTASIIARSTVDTSVTGALALTVRQITPASISIQRITIGNTLTPVNINATAGQIDVTLTLDPGEQQVDSVQVLIDGEVACSQRFTAAQAAEISEASLNLQPRDIVCSINTARFDPNTGIPDFFNGQRQVSARLFARGQAQPTATPSTTLTFLNASGFAGTVTTSATSTTVDAAGFAWRGGDLTVRALPVIFTEGVTATNVTVSFGGCASIGGVGAAGTSVGATARTKTAALANGRWEVTFASTGTDAVDNVSNYELNAQGITAGTVPCPITITLPNGTLVNGNSLQFGEIPRLSAVSSAGDQLVVPGGPNLGSGFINPPNNALGFDPALAVRLDNRPPSTPSTPAPVGGAIVQLNTNTTSPVVRTNNWVNAALVLNGASSSNRWDLVLPDTVFQPITVQIDSGVSRPTGGAAVTYEARVGAASLGNSGVDALAPVTSVTAAGLAETAGNNVYLLRARAVDALGNATTPVGQTFGVDLTNPTLAIVTGSVGANGAVTTSGALTAQSFSFLASDPLGANGVTGSGFVAAAPLPMLTTISQVTITGGTRFFCPATGTFVTASGTCSSFVSAQAFATSFNPNFTGTGNTEGYYGISAQVTDQAGNTSSTFSRTFVFDFTAPITAAPQMSPVFPVGGAATTFTAVVADNLDLGSGRFFLTYAGFPQNFQFPDQTVGTFGADVFTTSGTLTQTTTFIRNIQQAPGGTPNGAIGNIPTTLLASVSDVAGNASAPNTSLISNVPTGTAYAGFTWAISAPTAATPVSRDNPTGNTNPETATLSAQVCGGIGNPSAFANPFANRVEFWAQTAGGTWRQIGISTTNTVQDPVAGVCATGRLFTFSIDWNPNTYTAPTTGVAYNVIAIGVNNTGDGLATDPNANVTVTP